jgi:predicted  nucleic acid-binding Zn-ribbon protein
MRAMSLDRARTSLDDTHKTEEENDLTRVKANLEDTNSLVRNLHKQMDDLREMVSNLKQIFTSFFFLHFTYNFRFCHNRVNFS